MRTVNRLAEPLFELVSMVTESSSDALDTSAVVRVMASISIMLAIKALAFGETSSTGLGVNSVR